LLKRITKRLAARKYCLVFETELDRVWPAEKKETAIRATAIHAFAKANGMSAVIHDPGMRVTFRKLS
jgi:hypothetical protein